MESMGFGRAFWPESGAVWLDPIPRQPVSVARWRSVRWCPAVRS